MKHIKRLKIELTLAILVLIAVLISGFFIFSPISIEQVAQAVTGDYNKPIDGQLTADDWNRLVNDFLDKESVAGDTMAGPLTMQSNINMSGNWITNINIADPVNDSDVATKRYVDDSVAIQDEFGNPKRMFCASGPAGGWADYGASGNSVMTVINTGAAGFTNNNIRYLASISGTNSGVTTGLDSVYNIQSNSFELHVQYIGWGGDFPGITGAQANAWGWQIHWCGIGD
jgi:hypothetical protein